MSLYDLLPPNSTQLERDLSRAVSFLPKLQGGPPTIRTAKRRNIPASVLPWLVYEYGLGEISAYLQDLNELIDQGIAWQRIRGTPASIVQAIGWLGLTPAIDETEAGSYRWSEFQIGLPEAAPDATVQDVIYLAGVSSPVRSRLNRVFAVYDFRPFILDDSLLSGGAILSDHSGTRPEWAGGVQVSFGRVYSDELVADTAVAAAICRDRGSIVELLDRFILDHSILGGGAYQLNALVLPPFAAFGFIGDNFARGNTHSGAWHEPNPVLGRDSDRGVEVGNGPPARTWGPESWGPESWSAAGAQITQITGEHTSTA